MIERLTPFFYYLISTYLRENELCNLLTAVDVYFNEHTSLLNCSYLRMFEFRVITVEANHGGIELGDILKTLKNSINEYYNIIFTNPITLFILFKQSDVFGR